jgi:hypothetical protein
MTSKKLIISYLALITLVVLGGWLWSGSFSNPDDPSGHVLLLMFAGFIITIVACVCLVILYNRNIPLMNEEQAKGWEQVRNKGKHQYIRGYVIRGLLMFIGLGAYNLIKYYKTDHPHSSLTGLFGGLAALVILFVIFPFLWAIREWNFKEKDYEILLQRKAQHNNPLQRRP